MIEIAATLIFTFCTVGDHTCYETITNCAVQIDGTISVKNTQTCINNKRISYE